MMAETRTPAANWRHGKPQTLPEAIVWYDQILSDLDALLTAMVTARGAINTARGTCVAKHALIDGAIGLADPVNDSAGDLIAGFGTAVDDLAGALEDLESELTTLTSLLTQATGQHIALGKKGEVHEYTEP